MQNRDFAVNSVPINLRNGWIKKETVEKVQQEEKSFKPFQGFDLFPFSIWEKVSDHICVVQTDETILSAASYVPFC